ncbi:MAG TPA: hypothetical protein VN635_07635 [Conexibacter sp.]|nr:hypothetical protein [Conexibacter sp.]
MTDAAPEPAASDNGQPTVEQAALAADALAAEPGEPLTLATPTSVPVPPSTLDERPQLAVGAAFAGGLALGLLLKRLGR